MREKARAHTTPPPSWGNPAESLTNLACAGLSSNDKANLIESERICEGFNPQRISKLAVFERFQWLIHSLAMELLR